MYINVTPEPSAEFSLVEKSIINRWRTTAAAALTLVMMGAALWFLHRELSALTWPQIVNQVKTIPTISLLLACVFAACSYAVLTLYDATALRYLRQPMPYRRSALIAFMAYAVGHNVGLAAISGGSIRYRLYSLAGLTASQIAHVVVFVTLTFALGAAALLGCALLAMPAPQSAILRLPHVVVVAIGALLFAVPIAYLAACVLHRAPLLIRHWSIELPRPKIALTQIAISMADMLFACATLYILLKPAIDLNFLPFVGIYLLAIAAGLISNVPGGIGVFEAVLIASLPSVNTATLLGTLLVYRLIYYAAPLALAIVLLLFNESRRHTEKVHASVSKATSFAAGITPQAIGTLVFLAGVVLLVSGAVPAVETRLGLIAKHVPLPLLEMSHMMGSVVGVSLLILARGLFRRLHSAWAATLVAITAGMVLSLLKGLDYEEAIVLGLIAISLWVARREFYRLGRVAAQPFPLQWIVAIVVVLAIALWVGLMSYRHVSYSDQLWWKFAFNAEGPRMLRAAVVSGVAALAFAVWKLIGIGIRTQTPAPLPDEQEHVLRVLQTASCTSANVALLGDKKLLWSADRAAFIMYQVSGNSWIALGDPVGPNSHHEELTWAFRELADRHNGRTVFYQVADSALPLYVDLGLTLSKLGEEARVALTGFSLQGSHRAALRQANNKAKKQGAVFEVLPRASVPSVAAQLRQVSDDWLSDKSTAEKGFSLGAFSEPYIAHFDCAVVRVEGEIVAFANLWTAPAVGELSIDLMRFDRRAPKGVMDYLFTELMLWGSQSEYQWFSLGMAPLSGMEQRALAPIWHRVGHLVFSHGEHFYNFEGLRNYKQKFDPQWSPRYLACPGGWLNLSYSLFDTSRLISGGVGNLIKK